MNETLQERLRGVKLLAMDFDGIHTDGYVYVDQDGRETVRCSRRDGLGIEILKQAGVRLVVISKEPNTVVRVRCEKLGIPCYHGVATAQDKQTLLKSLHTEYGIPQEQVLYIGDDINDLDAIAYAGVGVTVADGHELVRSVADIVLTRPGGNHAVRELCELIMLHKGIPPHGGMGV